ncbi:FecR family protein [Allopusillimonas soli]|uniref:FecR domain-containing protein n=1 Tax=Allopusillimonas soli TaxID=659016 RepID=A0A853FD37_9BURK|nr:FecR domain-containing protein [Allopusillimonas soli]NYT37648.1 FecR domain-containing protein [Allopusillimonas soli]
MPSDNPVMRAAAHWMILRREGLSDAQEQQFQEWLQAAPAHQKALTQMESLWERLGELPVDRIRSMNSESGACTGITSSVDAQARPWTRRALMGAGAGVIAAGFAAWVGIRPRHGSPVFQAEYTSARGERQTVNLPDGSHVELDTATSLSVTMYASLRHLWLREGQALFTVAPDPQRRFEVLAGKLRAVATGTCFCVRSTQSGLQAGLATVAVEQGSVSVMQRRDGLLEKWLGDGDGVEIRAGQAVTAYPDGKLGEVISDAAPRYVLWRENRVTFDATTLGEALSEFARYAPLQITFSSPRVAALRISGSYDVRRIDTFLKRLQQVLPVQVRINGYMVQISSDNAI